jgi:hypothetical protein
MSLKFKVSTEVNLPINDLFKLFLEKEKFKNWKKDFIDYEHISGEPGEIGAMTKLIYKRQTMVETIASKNPPTEIIANYEHQQGGKTNMFHTVSNRFTSLTEGSTRLEVETEITKLVGLFFKILIPLMAGAGKKYAQTQLDQLKAFAEKHS